MHRKFNNPYITGGDPYVLFHDNKYYLYCTREFDPYSGKVDIYADKEGFEVYVSDDMENWSSLGFCLEKGENVVGNGSFWAPEVYFYRDRFYMVYSTDEHIAIAVADKPEGPFYQHRAGYLREQKTIDSHLFFDDDGRVYIYYADLSDGNQIFAAEMEEDLSAIKAECDDLLIKAEAPWETLDCHVAEGPFVLKHKGLYYLTYSCNHFRCVDYAVGFATSKSPSGPFEKYENNPILIGKGKLKGYGHHSFMRDENGELICVHHCHDPYSDNPCPRRICFHSADFIPDPDGGADVLKVFTE